MKKFLSSVGGKICIIALAVVLTAGLGFGGYMWWYFTQPPHVQDLTLELGSPVPAAAEFLVDGAEAEQVSLLTEEVSVEVGSQTLEFRYGWRNETAVLTVVDTTAPVVTFRDITIDIATVPTAEDFVESIEDLSETTVSFVKPPQAPKTYGAATVEVVVTDASGNQTSQICNIHYVWMYPSVTLELGQQLTKEMILLNPERDGELIDQAVLDEINAAGVGEFTVTGAEGENTCLVTVQDTTAPALQVQNRSIDSDQTITAEAFVVEVSDISGEVEITFAQTPDFTKLGEHTVTILATDVNGNVASVETTLKVSYDTTPPTFAGVGVMAVEKYASPDYTKGVVARDSRDGEVSFTYDDSKVNTSATGTYYVVYTATDSQGNTATYRRKVMVDHDSDDTQALVTKIAANLAANAESLRDYVRNNIYYSHDSGGKDAIWHGFKERHGDCYVHAKCLDALLREKGFQTMLIWCTDKSHYWNMVNIDGTWYHIDATPGVRHTKYSLMNDAQRHETLGGRDWVREDWPSAG